MLFEAKLIDCGGQISWYIAVIALGIYLKQ